MPPKCDKVVRSIASYRSYHFVTRKKLFRRLLGRCFLCKVRPNYAKVFSEKFPKDIVFYHPTFLKSRILYDIPVSCTAFGHRHVLSLCLDNRIFVTRIALVYGLFRRTGQTINFTPKLKRPSHIALTCT